MSQEPVLVVREPGEGVSLSVAGDVVRVLAGGAETGNRYALFHLTIPPGGGPPPHIHHRETEAFFVLKGTLTFYALAEGRVVQGGPGFFIQLPQGRPHRFANETDQPAETLVLAAPAGLEQMFCEGGVESRVSLPMTPELMERLLQAAPRWGVELLPPP